MRFAGGARAALLNLAVCRVVLSTLILRSEELWNAQQFASAGETLRAPAEGLAWAVSFFPLPTASVSALQVCTGVAALLTIVGLWTHAATAVLALSTALLFALPHFAGSPRHSMHVVWFVLVLSLSPSGRTWSLDEWWARHRRGFVRVRLDDGFNAAASLRVMWGLLGAVYFFPGVWKLWESGWAWIWSDNLQNQMHWKWAQFGAVPSFASGVEPLWIRLGALAIVAFELGFPLLMFTPWTRLAAALLGLAFHEAADRMMYLGFSSLWWCYVVLVDWAAFVAWLRRVAFPERGSGRGFRDPGCSLVRKGWRLRIAPVGVARAMKFAASKPRLLIALGVELALVFACVVQGVRGQMYSYPFACYPTFQWIAGPRMPDLRITLIFDGEERMLPDSPASFGQRSQYRWGSAWRAMGVYDGVPSVERLRAYLNGSLPRDPERRSELLKRASAARFYRVDIDVRPGHWSDPAPTRLLAEISLSGASMR